MDRKFPRLVIRRDKLRNNFTQVITRCRTQGISVAGVVKGVNGLPASIRNAAPVSWPPAVWSRSSCGAARAFRARFCSSAYQP